MTVYITENKQMRGIESKLVSQAIKLFYLSIFLVNKMRLMEHFHTLLWVQDYILIISSHFFPKEDSIDVFKALCYSRSYYFFGNFFCNGPYCKKKSEKVIFITQI